VTDQSSSKDLDQQLAFRHRFAREFAMFCQVLRSPRHPGLVIFIDDLDRCGSRQTVDVLEAINFVTTAGRCFVVLGFDEDKVKAAIADVYKDPLLERDEDSIGPIIKAERHDLFRFATNYLEKLVHLIVPVPRSQEDAVEKLLGLKTVLQPTRSERRFRRLRRAAGEGVRTLLVVALLGAVVSLAWSFVSPTLMPQSERVAGGGARPDVEGNRVPGTGPGPQMPDVSQDSERLPPKKLSVKPGDLAAIPPSLPVAVVLLLLTLAGLRYLPRLFAEPPVDDSGGFRDALRIWIPVIARRRQTPRAVKRFVNRLRFLAMRVRDVDREAARLGRQAPINEPLLVAYAAIEEADDVRTGRAAPDRSHERMRLQAAVRESTERFMSQFGTRPDANPDALAAYRVIAGIVEERGAGTDAAPPLAPKDGIAPLANGTGSERVPS
jgi:hypothetical protein